MSQFANTHYLTRKQEESFSDKLLSFLLGQSQFEVIKIKLLVNCALPYANGPLHLGHIAGVYIGADIFVRYHRLMGDEVLFVSGSDEYGTPITLAADKEKTTPDKISERYYREHSNTFRNLDINFDIFSRTTYDEHSKTVQEIFLDLYNKRFLVEKNMLSPYCPICRKFMPDRYIIGTCPHCGFKEARGDQCDECGRTLDPQDLIDPRCRICEGTPEFRETNHFFLRLDAFQDDLLKWLENKDFWRHNVLSFTKNFIQSGLKERPITRDISWGVKIPLEGYEEKRIYVWFDALIGYISGAKIYSKSIGDEDYWKQFYYDKSVKSYYFIGKDNITFHSVIWPAILLGIGNINLPYDVPANEYLTFKGEQFSKSRGIGFTADEILSIVEKDYLRFYLAMNLPEGGDTDFTLEDLVEKVNSEYIDKFGNFIHRIVSFVNNNNLTVTIQDVFDNDDEEALKYLDEKLEEYQKSIEGIQIKKGLQQWLEVVKYANAYVNRSKPWELIKKDKQSCLRKLYVSLKFAKYLTFMIFPYTPSSAENIWKNLGFETSINKGKIEILREESAFYPKKSTPPFKKIEISTKNPNVADLVVGKITEVRDHPNADSLYLLKVSLGERDIQLIAGMKKYYPKEDMLLKKIIVVKNLKKAKIRGEVSEGMMLAADDGKKVSFLTVEDQIPEGSSVKIGEYDYNGKGSISIEELRDLELTAESQNSKTLVFANIDGKKERLSVDSIPVYTLEKVENGAIVR